MSSKEEKVIQMCVCCKFEVPIEGLIRCEMCNEYDKGYKIGDAPVLCKTSNCRKILLSRIDTFCEECEDYQRSDEYFVNVLIPRLEPQFAELKKSSK